MVRRAWNEFRARAGASERENPVEGLELAVEATLNDRLVARRTTRVEDGKSVVSRTDGAATETASFRIAEVSILELDLAMAKGVFSQEINSTLIDVRGSGVR